MSRLTVGIIAVILGLLRLFTENQPWPFEWVTLPAIFCKRVSNSGLPSRHGSVPLYEWFFLRD